MRMAGVFLCLTGNEWCVLAMPSSASPYSHAWLRHKHTLPLCGVGPVTVAQVVKPCLPTWATSPGAQFRLVKAMLARLMQWQNRPMHMSSCSAAVLAQWQCGMLICTKVILY